MDAQGKLFTGSATADAASGDAATQDTGGRRPSRDSLFLTARMTIGDEAPRDARVRNLSERGLMVEVDRALAAETPVLLELRGIGQVTGRVAWYAEGRAGIALDREIDPARARRRIGTRAR